MGQFFFLCLGMGKCGGRRQRPQRHQVF